MIGSSFVYIRMIVPGMIAVTNAKRAARSSVSLSIRQTVCLRACEALSVSSLLIFIP